MSVDALRRFWAPMGDRSDPLDCRHIDTGAACRLASLLRGNDSVWRGRPLYAETRCRGNSRKLGENPGLFPAASPVDRWLVANTGLVAGSDSPSESPSLWSRRRTVADGHCSSQPAWAPLGRSIGRLAARMSIFHGWAGDLTPGSLPKSRSKRDFANFFVRSAGRFPTNRVGVVWPPCFGRNG